MLPLFSSNFVALLRLVPSIQKIIFPLQLIFRSVERKTKSFLIFLYWSNFNSCWCFFRGFFSACTHFIRFYFKRSDFFVLLSLPIQYSKWFMVLNAPECGDIVSHLRTFSFVSAFFWPPSLAYIDWGLFRFFLRHSQESSEINGSIKLIHAVYEKKCVAQEEQH